MGNDNSIFCASTLESISLLQTLIGASKGQLNWILQVTHWNRDLPRSLMFQTPSDWDVVRL